MTTFEGGWTTRKFARSTLQPRKAKRDLQDATWRAYKWVLFLGKDNAIKEMDLGLIHSSADNSLGELIRNRLTQVDELTDGVGANTLLRNWPPFKEWTTKAVRDAFYASPALRRLLDPNAIKRTIAQGVTVACSATRRRIAKEGSATSRWMFP